MTPTAVKAPGISFDSWLKRSEARWALDWSNALPAEIPSFRPFDKARLLKMTAACVQSAVSGWQGGLPEPMQPLCETLAGYGLEQGFRISDLARALEAGRRTLLKRIASSRLASKTEARDMVEQAFNQALYGLLDAFQMQAERREAEARRQLEACEVGAARFQQEWDILDQILAAMNVGIILLDSSLKVIWMNRGMPRDLLAVAPERAVGRPCAHVLRLGCAECKESAQFENEIAQGTVQRLVQTGAPGATRDYLMLVRPVTFAAVKGPHVMQIFLDITSQQETQRSLARTREMVRNILDSSVNAIIATDTEGRITVFNRTASRVFGLSEEEVLGARVSDYYVGGRAEAARITRSLREQGFVRDTVTAFRDKKGLTVPVRLTASLLKDERGEVIGTMGFAQDISIEEALRKEVASRDRYLLSLLHGSTDGLITVDSQGHVASWNRGAALIFGIQADKALGKPIETFLKPEHTTALPAQGDLPASERFEYTVRGNGRAIDLLVTRTEISGAAERGVSYVLKDVTELKRLQAQLSEAEHLAELGRLAASIAHEIKNPIAGLRGAMEVMGGVHVESDPRFAIFREALSQIRRLDALVKDLLAYARPLNLRTEPVPVHLLVEASVGLCKEALSSPGVAFKNLVREDLPNVIADPLQIQQVLANLLTNATQAMPDGGTVTVDARAEKDSVVMTVADTGTGIPPEVMANMFKPFFTTKHVGTGLGLSIVQRLVRGHGGWCEVSSEPGKGTVFTIRLPAEKRNV